MVTLLIGVFRPIYNWIRGPIFLPWMKKTLKNRRGLKICGLLFFRNARGAQSKTWEAGGEHGENGIICRFPGRLGTTWGTRQNGGDVSNLMSHLIKGSVGNQGYSIQEIGGQAEPFNQSKGTIWWCLCPLAIATTSMNNR